MESDAPIHNLLIAERKKKQVLVAAKRIGVNFIEFSCGMNDQCIKPNLQIKTTVMVHSIALATHSQIWKCDSKSHFNKRKIAS